MKMLTRDADKQYLLSIKNRLEEDGIPTVIQGNHTYRLTPFPLMEPTLWVYLDEQFDDATKLMADPNHVVITGIDTEVFYARMPPLDVRQKLRNNTLIRLALFFVGIMVAMFLIVLILDNLH